MKAFSIILVIQQFGMIIYIYIYIFFLETKMPQMDPEISSK